MRTTGRTVAGPQQSFANEVRNIGSCQDVVLVHMFVSLLFYFFRRKMLEESLLYQKILVNIDEEEGWLNEKITLVSSEEVVDTLAAVQVKMES